MEIRRATEEALGLAGQDIGTPFIHVQPPTGVAFFGPVIGRLPQDERAAELWDHVVGMAGSPGFAKFKRSLRAAAAAAFSVEEGAVGWEED